MIINKKSWHYNLFLYSYSLWNNFTSIDSSYRNDQYDRSTVSTCQYLRYLLIWLPVATISQIITYFSIFYVLIYFPYINFGVSYFITTLKYSTYAIIAILGLIGFVWGACKLINKIIKNSDFHKRTKDETHNKRHKKEDREGEKVGFHRILINGIMNFGRQCDLLYIKDE